VCATRFTMATVSTPSGIRLNILCSVNSSRSQRAAHPTLVHHALSAGLHSMAALVQLCALPTVQASSMCMRIIIIIIMLPIKP
jgi:hypothetical protein